MLCRRPLEELADVLQRVNMFYGAIAPRCESLFKRLRGANVSGAGSCGQQQYARLSVSFCGSSCECDTHQADLRWPAAIFFQDAASDFFAIRRTASGNPEIHD